MRTPSILRGFDDPVGRAQQTFRAALDALSHPGRLQDAPRPEAQPAQMSPAMAALLLTLADHDTPVWLPAGVSEELRRYLRFHCGCPLVDTPAAARFVVALAGFDAPALGECDAGDPAYPDRSASLLMEVASLEQGPGLRLTGPGIQTHHSLSLSGPPPGFWADWRANHRRFPLGVDVFFVEGDRFCALPRTTRVEEQ